MSPRYYRDRLARYWWLLLLCAVCAGVGGWVGGALLFRVYSSTAVIQVDIRTASPKTSAGIVIDRLTHSGAQLAVSDGILSPIAAHEGMSVAQLHSEVTAVPVANTSLLSITVRDSDSRRAARLANAVADAVVKAQAQGLAATNAKSQLPYINQLKALSGSISDLQSQLAQLGKPPSDPAKAQTLQAEIAAAQDQYATTQSTLSKIQAIEAAEVTTMRVAVPAPPDGTPVSSHQITTMVAGAGFGLVLGVLLVIGGELLNARVRSPEEVMERYRWARLGAPRIVRGVPATSSSMVAEGGGMSDPAARLQRDIEFLSLDQPLRVLALVSANPSLRTSELAARLALAFARSGRSTLLVDAQLQESPHIDTFGVPAEPGLSELILQSRNGPPSTQVVMTYLRTPTRNGNPYLRLLPAGDKPPNPVRALGSESGKAALAAISTLPAEMVLLDSSSALFSGNVASLPTVLDGALVLIDPVTARLRDVAALERAIDKSTIPIRGFVYLDDVPLQDKFGLDEMRARPSREERLVSQ